MTERKSDGTPYVTDPDRPNTTYLIEGNAFRIVVYHDHPDEVVLTNPYVPFNTLITLKRAHDIVDILEGRWKEDGTIYRDDPDQPNTEDNHERHYQ